MRRLPVFLSVVLFVFGLPACLSEEVRFRNFVKNFQADFFEMFPDSTALKPAAPFSEKWLNPPNPNEFESKRTFLDKKLAKLNSVDLEKLSPENQQVHRFLQKKLEAAAARLTDFSSINALPILESVWKNGAIPEAKRRANFEKLLARLPAYFEGAKMVFQKNKPTVGYGNAVAEHVEICRFLIARRADFPENERLEDGILAVKDWLAFCESRDFSR